MLLTNVIILETLHQSYARMSCNEPLSCSGSLDTRGPTWPNYLTTEFPWLRRWDTFCRILVERNDQVGTHNDSATHLGSQCKEHGHVMIVAE